MARSCAGFLSGRMRATTKFDGGTICAVADPSFNSRGSTNISPLWNGLDQFAQKRFRQARHPSGDPLGSRPRHHVRALGLAIPARYLPLR